MTTETPVDPNTDDLDAFNDLLNGKAPEASETPDVTDDNPEDNDDLAPNDDADGDDDDELVENPDDGEDSLLKVPKPKLTARERIEQLNAKYREEERARQEVERQLEALKAEREKLPAADTAQQEPKGPTPDDLNADGSAKYELGEFDPKFVSDLADFRFEQKIKVYEEERAKKERDEMLTAAENELKQEWQNRLVEVEKEIPDIRVKAASLEPIFSSIDPTVGEYLAMTIMSLDNGPEVLAYLADNTDEAKKIVSSTPQSATIALGRLDALVKAPAKAPSKKLTEAPSPPPQHTRGSGGRFEVAPDTDDLEAFEKLFYPKK